MFWVLFASLLSVIMASTSCTMNYNNYICRLTVTPPATPSGLGNVLVTTTWGSNYYADSTKPQVQVTWGTKEMTLTPNYGYTEYFVTGQRTNSSINVVYELIGGGSSTSFSISAGAIWAHDDY